MDVSKRAAAWFSPARIAAVTVLGSIPIKLLRDPLNDPDLWWHLRTGALIAGGGIPKTDPFSITFRGQPWVVQEWGAELLMHRLREWFGLAGILAFRSVVLLLVYIVVARILVRRMGSGMGTWGLLALGAYAGSANWTERPNLLSFLFFAMTLDLLERKGRSLWLFIPLVVLWANVHGMVIMGVGLVLVVMVTEWIKLGFHWENADRAWAVRLLGVTAVGSVATLANPAGFGLIAHAFRLIGTVNGIVTEWASPDFHELSALVFLFLVLLTFAAMILNPKRVDLTDLALTMAFVVLALNAVRNLALASIILAFVCAGNLPAAIGSLRSGPKSEDDGSVSYVLGGIGWVMVIGGFAGLLISGLPQDTRTQTLADKFPVASIDALRAPGANVFVYDVWAGMVIDRAWPLAHVYADLRGDFYGGEHINTYRRALAGIPGWDDTLDRGCITDVLVPPRQPLSELLSRDSRWERVRVDAPSVTYHRVGPSPQGCA